MNGDPETAVAAALCMFGWVALFVAHSIYKFLFGNRSHFRKAK